MATGTNQTIRLDLDRTCATEWFPKYHAVTQSGLTPAEQDVLCYLINLHKTGRPQKAHIRQAAEFLDLSRSSAYRAVSTLVGLGMLVRVTARSGRASLLVPAGDAETLLARVTDGAWSTAEAIDAAGREHRSETLRRRRERYGSQVGEGYHPLGERGAEGREPEDKQSARRTSARDEAARRAREAQATETVVTPPARKVVQKAKPQVSEPELLDMLIYESMKAPREDEMDHVRELWEQRCSEVGARKVLAAYRQYKAELLRDSSLMYAKRLAPWLEDGGAVRSYAIAARENQAAGASLAGNSRAPELTEDNFNRRLAAMEQLVRTERPDLAEYVASYKAAWAGIYPRQRESWMTSRTFDSKGSGMWLAGIAHDNPDLAERCRVAAASENAWRETCSYLVKGLQPQLEEERPFNYGYLVPDEQLADYAIKPKGSGLQVA